MRFICLEANGWVIWFLQEWLHHKNVGSSVACTFLSRDALHHSMMGWEDPQLILGTQSAPSSSRPSSSINTVPILCFEFLFMCLLLLRGTLSRDTVLVEGFIKRTFRQRTNDGFRYDVFVRVHGVYCLYLPFFPFLSTSFLLPSLTGLPSLTKY